MSRGDGGALVRPRYGHRGRVLFADLSTRTTHVETVDEAIYRDFLGGYGLGAWLMWKHFPAGPTRSLPRPFSGRIQIVGKSPLTGGWADSSSGGSVCSHLKQAGFDAVVVRGKAEPAQRRHRAGDGVPRRVQPARHRRGELVWDVDDAALLRAGERIQNLRAAFNRREGVKPDDFAPHPRMLVEGDGHLTAGPLKGIRVPLPMLKDDYFSAMHWDRETGHLARARATELGIAELLAGFTT